MYSINDPKKRAVGFKLSEGMEVPEELEKNLSLQDKNQNCRNNSWFIFCIKGEY